MSKASSVLRLEEKCRLLGGASTWRTHAIDHAGIPTVKMTDGPNGARGDGIGAAGTAGLVAPAGIVLGATWDPAVVEEVGELLGRETRRKSAHVLLAPTINLHRTPIGGRVFECYSEDPELTAALATAYVRGVQSQDVGVAVKHFVANDTELDRHTIDVAVDHRTLRELYLRPFEAVVTEARPWGLMSAYNKLDGTHCSEHRWLLQDVLRGEWGFDGFVVSDWFGFHDTVASVEAGLTLAMPGPHTCYGALLEQAVVEGHVAEARVDQLVDQLALLAERTQAAEFPADTPERAVDEPRDRAVLRRAAASGMTLLRNEGDVLPLARGTRIALVGPNAAGTQIMGGGSAGLHALPHASILDALQAADGLVVGHEPGVRIDRMPPVPPTAQLRTPDGEPGLLLHYRNGTDPESPIVVSQVVPSSLLIWIGGTPEGVDPASFNVTVEGDVVPRVTGTHALSAFATGPSVVQVGTVTVLDDPDGSLPRGEHMFGRGSEEQRGSLDLVAGQPVPLRFRVAASMGFCGIRVGIGEPEDPDALDRAVELAAGSDVAVVVVGTNAEWETEGSDRATIDLPGDQNELVGRVASVAPRTVVLVNAGGPVAMPWVDDVDAVLLTPFAGLETAAAAIDVLTGTTDPGGRLPLSYPRRLDDSPAMAHYAPVDGTQTYGEGLAMGYRGHLAGGDPPLFPFGHGLSYGRVDWGEPTLVDTEVDAGADIRVQVPVSASGDRPATVVPQVYVSLPKGVDDGGAPWKLGGWTKLVVEPGTTTVAEVTVPAAALRRWDEAGGGWVTDTGVRRIRVGASSEDVRADLEVRILR